MESIDYGKTLPDGTRAFAPDFTIRVLAGIPLFFQIAEWLIVTAAFKYADIRFHFFGAKVLALLLGACMALYIGVLISHLAWRFIKDPYGSQPKKLFVQLGIPCISGGLVFFLLKVILDQIVAAH